MGLLRNLAQTIFGFLLLATLWVTALSSLSMPAPATQVITDLGVDALNPWLVSKGFGVSTTTYTTLQQEATAHPGQMLSVAFLKPQIHGSDIVGKSYDAGLHVIYGRVAEAYYNGGFVAAFALPAPVAAVVQTFALFPQQYSSVAKTAPLPTFMQPFLTYTGLAPDSLTATGHARIAAVVPKFWTPTLILAAILVALSFLSRQNPVTTLGLAVWHGSWPTVALFGILWTLGKLYPANVAAVTAAFGVVAASFLPIYIGSAAVGGGAYLISRFAGSMLRNLGKSAGAGAGAAAMRTPVAATARRTRRYDDGGYADHRDNTPPYVPRVQSYQPGGQPPSRAGQQPPTWNPQPTPQPWEPQPQPGQRPWEYGNEPTPGAQPGWNTVRPWDAPDPNAPTQDYGGGGWGGAQSDRPNDPNAPRW